MQLPMVSDERNTHMCGSGGRIVAVDPGSAGDAAGLRPGDLLLAINGHAIHDVLDYQFYAAEDTLTLQVRRADLELTVHLSGVDHLGLRFAESTFDGIRCCRNRCSFCFVKQLPKGMRRSLYVKDDDYRYSVRYGSFVTLSNLTEEDWQRLAEQRLSPLRISVHTTDPELRRRMLGNAEAPDVLEQLRRLAALGLEAHVQLVLCPGINDGEHLARTVADLAELYPAVQSIAAVPVGLTRQNRRPELRPFTSDEAAAIAAQVAAWQREYRRRNGVGLVYLGDEFYLLAGRPMPAGKQYDGYPQYENGIGLVRSLLDEWARFRKRGRRQGIRPLRLSVACGVRIAPVLAEIAAELSDATPLSVKVIPVVNEFFGPTVTVSGLLTAGDVRSALVGDDLGDVVVLPRTMIDASGERFLDDATPDELESALQRPVRFARTIRDLITLTREMAA